MGCFSVSCGITKLTIRSGDRCLLLPLIASKEYDDKSGEMVRKEYVSTRSTHLFLYSIDMWGPFCLPIEGVYNDYGSIEDIVKNENTEIIEKYFGISIEEFVSLITDGRNNVYDRFSNYSNVFLKYPEDLDYDASLENFFIHLGFERYGDIFKLNNKCRVDLISEKKFKVFIREEEKEYSHYEKFDFLKDYNNLTGEYLGVKEEMIDKMELINKIGGMFILKDAYDFYAKNHLSNDENIVSEFEFNSLLLKDIGFVSEDDITFKKIVNGTTITVVSKSRYDNTIEGIKFYNTDDFIKHYNKLTGEVLNLSLYNGMDIYDWEEYIQKKIGYESIKKHLMLEYLYLDSNASVDWDNIDTVCDFITQNEKSMILLNIENFLSYCYLFRDCETLKEIYFKDILKGTILTLFTEFKRLFRAISLSNIMFIPSFCGTQCGCNEAEVKLAYITNQIVEQRQEELKEDLQEEYKVDPMSGFNSRYY